MIFQGKSIRKIESTRALSGICCTYLHMEIILVVAFEEEYSFQLSNISEVKGRRTAENNEQQPLQKRKFKKFDSGEEMSFEEPMRLKQILRRKTGGVVACHPVGVKMINVKEKKTTSMTAGNGGGPEPVEGEDYNFDEGHPDDEFLDEDDDDFARKLDVVPHK
ncbi:hypothetical protein T459_11359 [Capsicum annuum]|uniref:Uncharacterized protein n=1 Tax=Capsicum annuum TaxID=4072 RepID=A0A2G2ZLP2_CAPAN|nr:hypothetical protein T459_11359 [Capsicum annuum]